MSETEVKKEVPEKAFTIRAIIIGIIGCFALVAADCILGPISGFVATAEVSVMTVVILALLQMFLKFKMSYAEYAVIYAMIYGAAASYGGWFTFIFFLGVHNAKSPPWLPRYAQFVPEFFKLPPELFQMALKGGTSAPFMDLMPATITGVILTLLMGIIGIFGTAPFRRQIVEIERLPYPATTAAFTAVSLAMEPPPAEERVPVLGSRRNWLLLGLLVGFITVIFTSGYLIETVFPGAMVIPHYIGDRPTASGILWGIIPGAALGLDMASMFPWSWFDYFAPMDALITITIMVIIVNFILTPLQIKMGILEYDPSYTIDDVYFTAWFIQGYKYHVIGSALLIGGVLGGYIAAWKYIAESLKNKEKEPGFVSPQLQWILSIIAVLIMTGIVVSFGGPPIPAFLMSLFLIYVFQMWGIRGLGEVNLQFTWIAHAFYPIGGISTALGFINTGELTSSLAGFIMGSTMYERLGDIAPSAFFESSRFAFLGKVRNIGLIVISIIIGLLIGGVFGALFKQHLAFSYGLTHRLGGPYYYIFHYLRVQYVRYLHLGGFHRYGFPDERFYAYLVLILIGLLIPVLRARVAFPIPFSPIAAGLTLLMSYSGNLDWGYGFIIILIVKWLVLKLGGTKLDEQVARPFFAGAAAGGLLGAVVSGIAAAWVAIYGPR